MFFILSKVLAFVLTLASTQRIIACWALVYVQLLAPEKLARRAFRS